MAELTTQRLLLRPVVREDLVALLPLAGDAGVAEMTRSIPHPLSMEDVDRWFSSYVPDREQHFVIERREDRTILGVIGLTFEEEGRSAEIGYWIGRPYWGQGYATEAVRRLMRQAFGDMKLSAVTAGVFLGNPASMRVLLKTGFREVGRAVRPAPARGGEREAVMFSATRASFAQAALSQAVGRQ